MPAKVRIQANDFDVSAEYDALKEVNTPYGAIATFVGLVRDFDNRSLDAIELECYESMAQKSLAAIAQKALARFGVNQLTIIHRTGRLAVNEQIVFVGVSSKHRRSAFDCVNFVMDLLKTETPFWKKEITASGEHWVDMKESDAARRSLWE
ncbi:MAG: molybdenum cofactor biosynthesis protein MoaE [Cellvibrionales bacterium]|nr:molybdenum cofactor biosynthesis protein MoaE [Cellvibrionales bacterium]